MYTYMYMNFYNLLWTYTDLYELLLDPRNEVHLVLWRVTLDNIRSTCRHVLITKFDNWQTLEMMR